VGQGLSARSEQILDLATQRRREKQVVDVEVEKALIVVFHLHMHPATAPKADAPEGVSYLASGMGSAAMADELYGLPASAIESIVLVEQITYVPGTPPWILGVVNVRGEIESVLDLKAVLGQGRAEITPESRLLIVHEGNLRSGLLVDRVVDIAYIPLAAIHPPPPPQEGGKGVYIAGETEYDEQTLLILNLSEIFHRALETEGV
jgi:purine-binding chemotaxis protein CheW